MAADQAWTKPVTEIAPVVHETTPLQSNRRSIRGLPFELPKLLRGTALGFISSTL